MKNSNLKKMLLIIGTVLLSFVAIGCSKTGDSSSSDGEVELVYTIWDSRQEPGLREIADDFEKENENIKVKIQVVGWDDYWTMLEAGATGGSLPDVFWMHSNEIYKYASNDMLLNLDDYIESGDTDLEKFPSGLVEIYNINDSQYSIPKDFDTVALWYNKTMFDEADLSYPNEDWTIEDLKDAAKQLTHDDQYGLAAKFTNHEGFYNFIYQNNGEVINNEGLSGLDQPEAIEALEYYFSFVKDGESPAVYSDDDQIQLLKNGQAAMGMFGSWLVGLFQDDDYLMENFDLAVLPSTDGNRVGIYNGLGHAIGAGTKHPEEAWKFVEHLSSEEAQYKQSELGVAISAYEGADEVWIESDQNYDLQPYIDMVPHSVIRPYTKETAVWESKSFEMLRDAYLGEKSVEEAAKETAEMMNEHISNED